MRRGDRDRSGGQHHGGGQILQQRGEQRQPGPSGEGPGLAWSGAAAAASAAGTRPASTPPRPCSGPAAARRSAHRCWCRRGRAGSPRPGTPAARRRPARTPGRLCADPLSGSALGAGPAAAARVNTIARPGPAPGWRPARPRRVFQARRPAEGQERSRSSTAGARTASSRALGAQHHQHGRAQHVAPRPGPKSERRPVDVLGRRSAPWRLTTPPARVIRASSSTRCGLDRGPGPAEPV